MDADRALYDIKYILHPFPYLRCVMSPIIDSKLTWTWSDCSMADGDYAFDAQLHRCLVDRKRLDSFVDAEHLMKAECGNGKIDAGEQCENMASGCCTDKCLLKAGAQCYEGPCCESKS